jgi:glycerate-2-kinase
MMLQEVKSNYGDLKFFVDGRWFDSQSNTIEQDTNPATGEVIAEFAVATDEEANAAIEAAYRAFDEWRDFPLRDRARLLFSLRAKFEEHFDELCRVLSQDHGRTIAESRGSVRRVIENIESACSALYRLPRDNEYVDQLAMGEAREAAQVFAGIGKEICEADLPISAPACILVGGETTVTIRGGGKGGRNQELALAFAIAVDGWERISLLSAGTDGTDGPTDAAGAIVSGLTCGRARQANLNPNAFLAVNNSNSFFESLGDLLITGPTRTNVMDIICMLVN